MARQTDVGTGSRPFQRATGSAPRHYRLSTGPGDSFVHLNRFERARSVLRGAERLEPEIRKCASWRTWSASWKPNDALTRALYDETKFQDTATKRSSA